MSLDLAEWVAEDPGTVEIFPCTNCGHDTVMISADGAICPECGGLTPWSLLMARVAQITEFH